MRRIVLLLLVVVSLQSCKEQLDIFKEVVEGETKVKYEFAIPTDWQLDNLNGKVKSQINIIKDSELLIPMKTVIVYDEEGNRMSEEILLPESDIDTLSFSRLQKVGYAKYKNNLRSYDNYVLDGKTLYSTDQQWFSPEHYIAVRTLGDLTYFIEGRSDSFGRIQSIDTGRQFRDGRKVSDILKMMFYDDKGYVIRYRVGLNGEMKDYEVKNKKFDDMGNILHQTIYDEDGKIDQDIRSVYEYYN